MLKSRVAANLIITILLVGVLAGIAIVALQSSVSQETSKIVYGQPYVPVPGASVYASGDNGTGSAVADSQGNYDITSFLDTGSYSVVASAPGFIDQQVDNINVTAGAETTNVDIYLSVSGGISGTVTDAVSGLPLPDVIVTAYNATGTDTSGQVAITDANGNYQIIQNLATGTYNVTIEFATGYLYTTLSGISVTAGVMTSNVNFALAPSGVITGTVTDANSGVDLQGIIVVGESVDGVYSTVAITNAAGQYTLNTNLPTDTYNVTELSPTGYLTSTVSGVSVTAGQTATINIALNPSGVISGTVTNSANGQPISGVSIYVTSTSGNFFGYATTDSSGNYEVNTDLGTASYVVQAIYESSFATYPTNVNVVAGQVTPNIDFQFTVTPPAPSGTISGQVTSSTDGPISDAYVSVQGVGGSESNYTDDNGNYIISTGLGTGTYTVNVTATEYVSQEQTGISVTVNQVTANVNFVLTPVISGSISGQVLALQANPFPTPTPSASPTPSPSPTPTPTPTPTSSPTPTPTPTATPIPTATPTSIVTPTPTIQPTATPKPTVSPTPTAKPTPTPKISPSPTPISTAAIPQGYIYGIVVVVVIVVIIAAVLALRKRETRKSKA